MSTKHAIIGLLFALATPSLALAQNAAPAAPQDTPAAAARESDDGGFFGSVKGVFGHKDDQSCATKMTVTNAAGNLVYVKRPNCP